MPYGSLSLGCEEHLDPAGTGSFYNDGEADIVVQHVFNLLYSGMSFCLFPLSVIFNLFNIRMPCYLKAKGMVSILYPFLIFIYGRLPSYSKVP